jgi:hypothetical protein
MKTDLLLPERGESSPAREEANDDFTIVFTNIIEERKSYQNREFYPAVFNENEKETRTHNLQATMRSFPSSLFKRESVPRAAPRHLHLGS